MNRHIALRPLGPIPHAATWGAPLLAALLASGAASAQPIAPVLLPDLGGGANATVINGSQVGGSVFNLGQTATTAAVWTLGSVCNPPRLLPTDPANGIEGSYVTGLDGNVVAGTSLGGQGNNTLSGTVWNL